ncbi:UPF0158 family protein [Mesonia aquimarina]|uniref:UPF0158 family protein n=1 Tax=Mesonia aquimarina TaxID=1504967 RepID=UPI000EF5C792|nr:UPF0158 family protein [Mesonia aquimarina]
MCKMNYSEKTIRELADLIDCGHVCFLEKTTEKIEYYPEETDLLYDEEIPWQDIIDKIENNPADYIRIEGMNSNQSFRVMEKFTGNIEAEPLREKVIDALNRPKPFGNFNYLVEGSNYRQEWFDFKLAQHMLWVKDQIFASEHE